MSPKAKRPEVTVQWNADDDGPGYLVAEYRMRRYRFLLSDGRVVDVVCHRDDGAVRGAVIDEMAGRDYGVDIVGMAVVDD